METKTFIYQGCLPREQGTIVPFALREKPKSRYFAIVATLLQKITFLISNRPRLAKAMAP